MKHFFKNIILSVISTIVTLAAIWAIGELLLRRSITYEMVDTEEMYVKSENKILNKELRPHYEGIYFGKTIKINSKGFRDYEYDRDKPKNVYRIALLGDSMCFGHGLELEDIYPKVLEKRLNNSTSNSRGDIRKIEVLNFSVCGYNTAQEYEYLKEKVIFYKPDLVVINFFLNDILTVQQKVISHKPPSKSISVSRRWLMKRVYLIKTRSHFAQYILSHLAILARRVGIHGGYISEFHGRYEDDNEEWLQCRQELLNIKRFTEDKNAELLVAIIPFLSDLNEHHPLKREIGIVEDFCKANDINTINLFPYFYGYRSELLWINPIDGHPNNKAHAIMAEAVSRHIWKVHLWALK